MKIIYPDCVTNITADSQDSNYPAVNLLDDHPKKLWKALMDVTTASLAIVTSAESVAGLHISGTNAVSGTLTIKDATEAVTYETHALSGNWERFFIKFNTTYTEILHITVSLTASNTIYAGVLRCGTLISLPDPQYGLQQQRKDYSIKKELSNGGMNIILRDMPRGYDLSFIVSMAIYDSMDNLFLANGSVPVAVLISDNINLNEQWCGFFHIVDPLQGSYTDLNFTNFSMSLREAI